MNIYKYFFLIIPALACCSRLELLESDISPEDWIRSHSHIRVDSGGFDFILAEPSSSFFVFLLAFVIAAGGLFFIKTRGNEISRLLWGIAFFFWSAATISAGVSYQAFSYEIKCSGRNLCSFTSWWEIWYLLLFVLSMNMVVAAVAFSSSSGLRRKCLIVFAAADSILYAATLFAGSFMPHRFLVSFECMLLFAVPVFAVLLYVNSANYFANRKKSEGFMALAWIFMFAVVVLYFLFYISGLASVLWAKGIWFNANDVLHTGLIMWLVYIRFFVSGEIRDIP